MLERVVDTLFKASGIEHVVISADAALLGHGLGPALDEKIEQGRVTLAEPKASPSESVAHILKGSAEEIAFPLLITTADHPLLTAEMVEHLFSAARDQADLVIGLAEADLIRAHYPHAIRTFYRFGGQGFSGCNLFLLQTSRAHRVVDFWQDMERHRKRPWRLVAAVGLSALIRFVLGRLSLEQALRHLSDRIGAEIGMVAMPFAEAAIDVDKPTDLDLAETILRTRSVG